MPPTAITAASALVVGIPGCRTPFAALAPAFFSPPAPGSVILWCLLTLPRRRGHVNLCPLRRRSRGERAPVKLGALCPRSGRERKRIREVEVVGVTTLVTGATGFIGANVVRALLDIGATVRVLTRPESDS